MATRRAVPTARSEKEAEAKEYKLPTADEKSNIAPAVPTGVIYKLLAFTFAMIALPISTYFATVNVVFGGNSTWAGATAAIMANVVLIGYIVVAFNEDQSEALEAARAKKGL